MDLVLKDVFTIDFGLKRVIISKKYQHVLDSSSDFINAMELIGKNKGDDQVQKYSIYPFEAKDLFVDQVQSNIQEELKDEIRHTTSFSKKFQEIYATDFKLKHDKKRSGNVSVMDEFLPDGK